MYVCIVDVLCLYQPTPREDIRGGFRKNRHHKYMTTVQSIAELSQYRTFLEMLLILFVNFGRRKVMTTHKNLQRH